MSAIGQKDQLSSFADEAAEQNRACFGVVESSTPRPMRPVRFALGGLVAGCGAGLILMIAVGLIQVRRWGGDFAMPVVALSVLLGVMLLGGGFGIMATSSAGFDEREFDRLASAGNLCCESTTHVLEPDSVMDPPAVDADFCRDVTVPSGGTFLNDDQAA